MSLYYARLNSTQDRKAKTKSAMTLLIHRVEILKRKCKGKHTVDTLNPQHQQLLRLQVFVPSSRADY